jgi:dienelactone hydrolase
MKREIVVWTLMSWIFAGIFVCAMVGGDASKTGGEKVNDKLEDFVTERNERYKEDLELWLRKWLVDDYPTRAERLWSRSYESIEAFKKSVEPNRNRWREVLNPPPLRPTGPLEREPHEPLSDLDAEWLSLPLGGIKAEGVLVIPKDGEAPFPLVIAQHGIGSTPEKTFGLNDPGGAYHQYSRELVAAGFAVLAPFNLRDSGPRNRIERLARLADTTLPGIELVRMQHLLTEVLKDERVDPERVGMWGLSLGGLATMFWMPLEERIKVGIVAAWFNHRRNKMAVPDPRYSCFLETTEEHAFFRGWLVEFADYDVVSLICPRPLLIQAGKTDGIAWWEQIIEEFELSRVHYDQLGLGERIELDLHEGGHEVRIETGIQFMENWLR